MSEALNPQRSLEDRMASAATRVENAAFEAAHRGVTLEAALLAVRKAYADAQALAECA
jgi:hypothetical protein